MVQAKRRRSGTLAKRLGKSLRQLRADKTLEQFATEIGISKSSLSRIERGEQNVLIGTLQLMCERLGLDVQDLFPPE